MPDITDLDGVAPEQIAQLLKAATAEQILESFRALGVEQSLDRTFQQMQEAFLPEKAQGVTADIQWTVTDEGQEHTYLASIGDGKCTIARTKGESPRVGLSTDLVSFIRLIMGQVQGPMMFMQGKLKVTGDLMFAQRFSDFFAQP